MKRFVKGLVVTAIGAGLAGCGTSGSSLTHDAGLADGAAARDAGGDATAEHGAPTGSLGTHPHGSYASTQAVCRADAPTCWVDATSC
jgi:hypothetical protein